MGLSQFATQTTVSLEKLNQIPRYLELEDFAGLKNPRTKVPPLETKTEPSSLNDWLKAKLSEAEQ